MTVSNMKFIPLPDNEPTTINKSVDEIYNKLNMVDRKVNELTGEFSYDDFLRSTDTEKITMIAQYLKLI